MKKKNNSTAVASDVPSPIPIRTLRAPFHWQRVDVAVGVAVDVVGGDSVNDKCSNHIANALLLFLLLLLARACSAHTLTHTHTRIQIKLFLLPLPLTTL